jgi:hypothetical protein
MSSSLDGITGLALVNGAVVTTINNSSGTTLMTSTSGDINIDAAVGFKVNLSNTSISGPMDINGSPGTAGQVPISQGPGLPAIWGVGGGSVTSVGLAMPSIFTVSNSPVIGAGTLTAALNTQLANEVLIGPSTGAAAVPTFRGIDAADITSALLTPPPIGATTPNSAIFTNATLTSGSITTAPVAATDIANKDYVDIYVQGLTSQSSVTAATTGPITLTGAQTVDAVPLTAGMECLVKDQAAPADNGVYVVSAGPWTRATTMSIWTQFRGAFVFVETGGTTNGGTGWVCTAPAVGTINVTAVTFSQFSAAGTYTAGAGLTLTGTVFSANETNYPLAVTANGTLAALLTANAVTDRAGNTYSLFNTTGSTVTLTAAINNAISYPANATAGSVIVGAGETVVVETVTASALYAVTSSSKIGGTVSSVSVAVANGFTGTVATATTTPVITLTTSIIGVVKGDGTALSAATVGTDYSAGTSALATGIVKNTTITGVLTIATAGTDYVVPGGALGTPASGVLTNATGLPLTTGVTGVLPIANGGTGQITAPLAINALLPAQALNTGKVLTTNGSVASWATNGSGTVTTVSVASANGFTGTVATATTTPVITMETSIIGVVKGDGTSLSAAVAGTDYVVPGGALGTPSSGNLSNCTSLPIATGVSGLGTGVATALAINTGSTGAVVLQGGAATLSNVTDSALTATRVVFAGVGGLLSNDADMTFDGTKITLANDASINGLTVGKGGGAIASNTAVGLSVLAANTSGNQNTASGAIALQANTTGSLNTANGSSALTANTSGGSNTASGANALGLNTIGINNTASGRSALLANTTGNNNTAVGRSALLNNTTGSGNSAFNPLNSAGVYAPVFNPTTEDDRFCLGSTSVTNAYINISWTIVSDARDKTNIAPVPLGLDFVKQLEPVEYQRVDNREDMNATGPVRYGFLAQDILAVEGDNPVIIDDEDPDHLKMNDSNLLSVMVNAIKELTARLEALEANNTAV